MAEDMDDTMNTTAGDTSNATKTTEMPQNSVSVTHTFSNGIAIAEAIEKVLETNELLENILVRLPFKKLLLAQRVCKQWNALIKGSLRLQRALFMTPVPVPGGSLMLRNGCEFRAENESTRDVPCLMEFGHNMYWAQFDSHFPAKAIANPAIFDVSMSAPEADWRGRKLRPDLIIKDSAWCRPEASWRHMLLSQPPTDVYLGVLPSLTVDAGEDGFVRAGDSMDSALNRSQILPEAVEGSFISASKEWEPFKSIEDLEDLPAPSGWSAKLCPRPPCNCKTRTREEEVDLDEFLQYHRSGSGGE